MAIVIANFLTLKCILISILFPMKEIRNEWNKRSLLFMSVCDKMKSRAPVKVVDFVNIRTKFSASDLLPMRNKLFFEKNSQNPRFLSKIISCSYFFNYQSISWFLKTKHNSAKNFYLRCFKHNYFFLRV